MALRIVAEFTGHSQGLDALGGWCDLLRFGNVSQVPHSTDPNAAAPPKRTWSDLVHGLLLLAAVLFIYSPTLSYEFVYDDHYYIVNNHHIAEGLTPANVVWSFRIFYFSNWHPLTSLSYFLDTSLYGKVPWGYRLTNILLHIVNIWLVFLVARKLTDNNKLAWWMAGVFALHTLHIESVVWISERKDVLSILFGLWAILAYIRYARDPSIRRYVAVCLLLIASLLSKQTLITFPFLLLLFDAWPLGRLRLGEPAWRSRLGKLVLEKLPMLAIAVFFGMAAIRAQEIGKAISSETSAMIRVINGVNALATYLRQSFWPTEMCAYYPHPFHRAQADAWFMATAMLLAIVCVLALTTLVGRKNETNGYVATGWFWFLGTLLPMLGVIQLGSAAHADRYMYFPQIGLSLLVGMFFSRVANTCPTWGRRCIALAAYASLGALTVVSSHQVTYWQNDVTLFRHALSITRDNSSSRVNLADGLINQAEELIAARDSEAARELLLEAEEHARAALRLRASEAGYHNLVRSLRIQGRFADAIEAGRKGVEKFPDSDILWFSLGWAYHAAGDAAQAEECYVNAIEYLPHYVDAFNRLAVLYAVSDPARAEAYCRQALSYDPAHVEARTNLGNALVRQGRFDEALSEYRRALEFDPENEQILENVETARELQRRR